jgi:hypothetical protein
MFAWLLAYAVMTIGDVTLNVNCIFLAIGGDAAFSPGPSNQIGKPEGISH